MINSMKEAIEDELKLLFDECTIYDEDKPDNFITPSFLITLTEQVYSKRLNNIYNSSISFDIAYFSNKSITDIKEDCQKVQFILFRGLDLVGGHRILGKKATIVDNVMHFTFNIKFSEILQEDFTKMQSKQTNTKI